MVKHRVKAACRYSGINAAPEPLYVPADATGEGSRVLAGGVNGRRRKLAGGGIRREERKQQYGGISMLACWRRLLQQTVCEKSACLRRNERQVKAYRSGMAWRKLLLRLINNLACDACWLCIISGASSAVLPAKAWRRKR